MIRRRHMLPALTIAALVVGIVLSTVWVAPRQAHAHRRGCFPVSGRFEANPVPPPECTSPAGFCTAGRLTGPLRGTYDFVAASFIPTGMPAVPAISFFTGESNIATRHGATLVGVDTGTIDLDPTRSGAISSLITFTGGTGHLTGATGQIQIAGNLDFTTGQTSGTYDGELCFAAP